MLAARLFAAALIPRDDRLGRLGRNQGVDPFLLQYLNQGADVHTPVVRTGVLMLDFPGGGLINKILSFD